MIEVSKSQLMEWEGTVAMMIAVMPQESFWLARKDMMLKVLKEMHDKIESN